MSASTAGALKSVIEGLGLGVSAYRDRPPQGAAEPYVTISELISFVPDRLEDGAPSTGTELVQVDVWQKWRNADESLAEAYTLAPAIRAGLHGAQLPVVGTRRQYVSLVRNTRRMLELDNNLVHHVIDVDVVQQA